MVRTQLKSGITAGAFDKVAGKTRPFLDIRNSAIRQESVTKRWN